MPHVLNKQYSRDWKAPTEKNMDRSGQYQLLCGTKIQQPSISIKSIQLAVNIYWLGLGPFLNGRRPTSFIQGITKRLLTV